MKNKLYWPALVSTTLLAGSLLTGCASDNKQPAAAPTPPPAPVVQQDRPGKGQADLITVTATVKAIDKKNRVVTLKFDDGHESKIKCGPEVRNFAQIRKGDIVKTQLLESVELFIADSPEKPTADRTEEMARTPKGAKPGVAAVDSVEVKATVASINYQTREVTLQGPEGGLKKIKVGPEVKRLAEIKQGDTVVARLTRAFSITVSTPAKK
jgi:translation initiation factor IF-1